MSSADDFKKLNLHQQILKRPDTYVGTNNTHTESRWIWSPEAGRMEWRQVTVNPALLKIFDEILVNALDHRVRCLEKGSTTPMRHLEVTITPERITVRNDGDGIPVDEHSEEKCWVPELIFGNLLTSSNYDDEVERTIGGMNGYGAKLTNIFSREFTLETVDAKRQKKYKQAWHNNMFECGKPSITKATVKPYTEISFVPDLTRFKWPAGVVPEAIPEDMLAILRTRVIDAAACAGTTCKVSLDGKPVVSNTFPKYIELFLESEEKDVGSVGSAGEDDSASVSTGTTGAKKVKRVAYEVAGTRWEIAAVLARDLHGDNVPSELHVSFVNGINTRRGGKHVELVSRQAMTAFCDYAKKKAKLADITPGLLKHAVIWFVNATIVNPSFDTQTKESLTTPVDEFGSTPAITAKFVEQLGKIGLLDEARALLAAKTVKDAKKTDGRKKSVIRGIPKLQDANWAGTAKSVDCTLILTEGDSAATTAISGLKVVGRDCYGVFPLKGKILNVKDISAAKKAANEELTNIKQILGLEHGKVYTDVKQLRYGRVMIMTDQDVDGSHIKGLLMNLFHTEWPSLLQTDFLCCLMTPLLKTTKGKQTFAFYSESEYEAWCGTKTPAELRGWHTKYYKGLGTSTAVEAREYFANMNTVAFDWDPASDSALDMAFNKKRADDRKTWLTTYDRARCLEVKAGGIRVPYSQFVNDELIHFSIADNARSIPHVMDGLKPSQRKILWAALKRNLISEIKVAQLAGYVSEHAAYHHGEASLNGAIVGMAQSFVGSNNLNLLAPNGQFGSRIQGGHDAASPRYIYTALEPIVKTLIHEEDAAILKYMKDDDGKPVEPETYMPVVPLLLVNGALGIGTGFSTTVLPYNPRDVTAALRRRLTGSQADLSETQLTPWWFGFRGHVQAGAAKTWITKGLYKFQDDDAATVHIHELPVGTWSQDYKEFLEEMLVNQEEYAKLYAAAVKKAGKEGVPLDEKGKPMEKPQVWLKSFESQFNDLDVNFVLHMDTDGYHEARAYPAEFEKRFKLTTSFKTSNMVAFDEEGIIHRYDGVGEILEAFYGERLAAYGRRKTYMLDQLRKALVELNARLVFVKAVVEKRLVVANAEDDQLLAGLKGLGVPPLSAPDSTDDLKAYEYLLRTRIDRLKSSAVKQLEQEFADAKAAMEDLERTGIEALWLKDLDAFDAAWASYEAKRNAQDEEAAAAGSDAGAPKKKVVKRTAVKKA
jgi:DNA topoisomerase-2